MGLNVIGLDIELPKNIELHKNVIWLKEDILDFDFTQKFDVIIAFNILQFLDIGNRNRILDKMYKALNPDGLMMIKSFTQKDPSYLKGQRLGQFAENELLEWAECKEMHISEYQEKEIEDFHQPIGKHTHGIVYFAGIKE